MLEWSGNEPARETPTLGANLVRWVTPFVLFVMVCLFKIRKNHFQKIISSWDWDHEQGTALPVAVCLLRGLLGLLGASRDRPRGKGVVPGK